VRGAHSECTCMKRSLALSRERITSVLFQSSRARQAGPYTKGSGSRVRATASEAESCTSRIACASLRTLIRQQTLIPLTVFAELAAAEPR